LLFERSIEIEKEEIFEVKKPIQSRIRRGSKQMKEEVSSRTFIEMTRNSFLNLFLESLFNHLFLFHTLSEDVLKLLNMTVAEPADITASVWGIELFLT
jgi:hypothetical protein